MNRKSSIIYLSLAPFLFLLSWYISHKVFVRYLLSGQDQANYEERSLLYASCLTGLYLIAFFIIRDLYKPKKA
jgi:TRAP-type C4-dicarboxylate transport system permease small subunit